MEHLLAHRPGFIRGAITFNLVFFCFGAAIGIYRGQGFSVLPFVAIAFAITTYLWVSVSRLSKEVSVKLIKPREKAADSAPPMLPPKNTSGSD
ncbi:MAG: hypothetical protein JWQ62_1978 [Lacunisphaera sp.]|nr:hypothetical protein [Lacunisphaera sp.]